MKTLTLMYFLFLPFCAIANCQAEKTKHQKLQTQLRAGHSAKAMNKLQQRERKAWQTWWQCTQGKSSKKKKRVSSTKKHNNKAIKQAKIPNWHISRLKTSPTLTNKPITIKGAFSGEKQQAWLNYYQKPQKCIKPKSTQQFAFCIEHARNAQVSFSQNYDENH